MQDDCPECEEWRARGARFCRNCGKALAESEVCPECDVWRQRGANYCRNCGRKLGNAPEPLPCPPEDGDGQTDCTRSAMFRLVATIALLAFSFTLIVAIAYGFIFFGDLMAVASPVGKVLFVLEFIAIIVSAAYAFYAVFRKNRGGRPEAVFTSGLCMACTGLCVSIFLTILYIFLIGAFGEQIDASWMDEYTEIQLAYLLLTAGPEEEFIFRVLPIGIPMVIVALCYGRGRSSFRYLLGGFGMSRWAWIFLAISAVIFGYAHLGGWGWTKIIDAAMGGVIFGFIYCEFGLYACILAHTVNDTISLISYIGMGDALSSLIYFVIIGAGLALLILWLIHPNRKYVRFWEAPWMDDGLPGSIDEQWDRH
ncbi:CAAX amino terminal protease family [Thermoplasmatales archaeon BRNA1]|nr:CAAX amino terminal protease family [Thermoplasmatales archaeon BRNA1]